MTPIEKLFGKKPSFGYLYIFIFVSWEHLSDDCKNKLDVKSNAGIMLGYSKESKAHQLFDPIKK